jgi:heme/copper-type cytochrome/quinol oxidase subunit 3
MTQARTLDVSGLPAADISNHSPLFMGHVLLCAAEASALLILFATYFYLRISLDAWPPPGTAKPDIVIPTLALIPLIASCGGSYWASESAKKNDRWGMVLGLGVNLFLALVFLAMRGVAWSGFNFSWSSDAHGSIVWSILFLHTYDVVADLLMTIVLLVIVASGRFGEKQRIGVHVDSVLWYFLVAIWLPLYAAVYLGPALVGTK